jgi:pilus assembly protein TadC
MSPCLSFKLGQCAQRESMLDLFQLLEVPAYFISFWGFILNKTFRNNVINKWRYGGGIVKFFTALEMLSSFFVGVVLPVWLVLHMMD